MHDLHVGAAPRALWVVRAYIWRAAFVVAWSLVWPASGCLPVCSVCAESVSDFLAVFVLTDTQGAWHCKLCSGHSALCRGCVGPFMRREAPICLICRRPATQEGLVVSDAVAREVTFVRPVRA